MLVEYTDCRGLRPPTTNERPGYDTKQSDGEAQVMLKFLEMRRTFSLPSLQGPLNSKNKKQKQKQKQKNKNKEKQLCFPGRRRN